MVDHVSFPWVLGSSRDLRISSGAFVHLVPPIRFDDLALRLSTIYLSSFALLLFKVGLLRFADAWHPQHVVPA